MLKSIFAAIDPQADAALVPAKPAPESPWDMLKRPVIEWDIEAMYQQYRGGPVSATSHVLIVTPVYGEAALILHHTDPSRLAVVEDLAAHGIEATILKTPGDSLVQRMRQRVVGAFMRSTATHLLWWDADIECLTPECVRKMIASDNDVVAGACPFKDDTGRVVCNLWPGDIAAGNLVVRDGCLDVQDAGTGFMLVTRFALASLMKANPGLLHFSLATQDKGHPLWAIYDTAVVDQVLLSEDYRFCQLWQHLGGRVFVYVPAAFKHWGLYGYTATLQQQYGLE